MLIDLARNDIGRVAEIGSVTVPDQFVIEKYSHIQHLVSEVDGKLRGGLNNFDVFKATFPRGHSPALRRSGRWKSSMSLSL